MNSQNLAISAVVIGIIILVTIIVILVNAPFIHKEVVADQTKKVWAQTANTDVDLTKMPTTSVGMDAYFHCETYDDWAQAQQCGKDKMEAENQMIEAHFK
jgi:predicted membrane protein